MSSLILKMKLLDLDFANAFHIKGNDLDTCLNDYKMEMKKQIE